jgi:CSLREA domain-containing protein
MLTVFTVNSFLDNGDGANTTLREAVQAANQSQDAQDIINFDGIFASGGTILLTQGKLSGAKTFAVLGSQASTAGRVDFPKSSVPGPLSRPR